MAKSDITPEFKNMIAKLPHLPGIYKMMNEQGRVLYIGKAKDLKKRVSSYFRNTKGQSKKTAKMTEQVESVDFIVVDSDLEAIMLETNLIKEFRPKYNILMKDDKNFAYIKIHLKEDYPRISITRKKDKDGSRYFGPKTSAHAAKETLKLLKKLFPYRHCPLKITYLGENHSKTANSPNRVKVTGGFKHPCIDYYIKRCQGPCIGHGTPAEYKNNIDQIASFLEGKTDKAMGMLKSKMMQAATDKKFEVAAKIRDKIELIEKLVEKQKISTSSFDEFDIINFVANSRGVFASVFQLRNGKITNQCNFSMKVGGVIPDDPEVVASVVQDYYQESGDIPRKILVPCDVSEGEFIEGWLSTQSGHKVEFFVPNRGKNTELLTLAKKNAIMFAEKQAYSFEGESSINCEKALEELAQKLSLEKEPKRIECYDISHLSGEMTVGSMVVFKNGKPSKKDYRNFKLRTVKSGDIDDFKSLYEVLCRRLRWLSNKPPQEFKIRKASKKDRKLIEEITSEWHIPISQEDSNEVLVVVHDKKIVGFVKVAKHTEKITELCGLWVDPEFRGRRLGYHLMQKVIDRVKVKRVYIIAKTDIADYHAKFGFIEVKTAPEIMQSRLEEKKKKISNAKRYVMVYDKNKHIKDPSFTQKPSLIVIDGGKGQLSSAQEAMSKMNMDIPMISLAKREEEVFVPNKSEPLNIPKDCQANLLLQRIRDEAHRFAIELNRNLRSKDMVISKLDSIKGIGAKNRKKLLSTFGSIENIKTAPIEEIKKIVGEKMALKIKAEL